MQDGETALVLASSSGNLTIVDALLRAKAKIDLPEKVIVNVWTYIFSMPTLITHWSWVGGIVQGSLLQGQIIAYQLLQGQA